MDKLTVGLRIKKSRLSEFVKLLFRENVGD